MFSKNLLKDEPLGEKLIKKWFWLYLFSYLAAPAWYLIRIIVSNSVTVEEVGILYSIVSFISLISIYNDLGLTESLKYFLPKYRIKEQYNYAKTAIFISLGVQIITALIIIIILWLVAPWLWEHYFHSESAVQVLRYFCFYFLWINIFQVLSSIYMAFQDTFNNQLIVFIKMWAIVLFTWSFFFLGNWSLGNYAIAWIWGLFVAIIASLIIFWKKYRQVLSNGKIVYDKWMIQKYKKYALRVFLWANASALLWQIDQQMIIFILWAESAWYYANYLSLININGIVIWPIMWLIFPLVAEMVAKKDIKNIWLLRWFMYTYFTIFALSLWALFVVLWPELAISLFGEKFILSGKLLAFGWWFMLLLILVSIDFNFLTWLWKVKDRVKIIAIVWWLNVIMNFIFMKFWWVYWVILSTIIWWIIIIYMSNRILNKTIKIKVNYYFIIKNTLFVILLWFILFYIKDYFFVLKDEFRVQNLSYLFFVFAVYYLCLWAINWKEIIILKKEILNIKR